MQSGRNFSANLLPAEDAERVRAHIKRYVDKRILFYTTRDDSTLGQINADTALLQSELWASVVKPAVGQPTAVAALAVAGMNDVLNAQGYAEAAWWNRIPVAVWGLMLAIAMFSNGLVGVGSRSGRRHAKGFVVLPVVISIAFMLIADIDAPRRGLIEVKPKNLINLAESLPAR